MAKKQITTSNKQTNHVEHEVIKRINKHKHHMKQTNKQTNYGVEA